jgi:MerR family transcriptional regulator, redox-sensitive transcriptional activator SoxR
MSTLLTIGEVARRAGVRASAIRYYEEAGLLEEPERVGGKRRYDEEALRRLALIGGAKRAGFTLGEIRTLLHGFPAGTGAAQRWQALASEKLVEVDEAIAQLRQTKGLLEEALRCECASLDECARLLNQT